MGIPTIDEMRDDGATKKEAEMAMKLFEVLEPGLRVSEGGLIQTRWGRKSVIGLYRTIVDVLRGDE